MQLNALHMRLGAMAGGILLVTFFIVSGGTLGDRPVIQLDFSMYPEEFEGLPVEIDGKVVGKLQRYGQAMRSGFEVRKGRHTVRVVHPEFDCEPLALELDKPGEKARILIDLTERYDDGRARTAIWLQI